MKDRLKLIAARIDALSLRERVLLFAAAVTILVMIPYSLGIQPAFRRQQLVLERIRQDQSQIDAMRAEIRNQIASRQQQPDNPARAKLDVLEKRLAEIEEDIARKQVQLVPAEKMPDLLRSVMGRSSAVELLSVTSVSGGQVSTEAPASNNKAQKQGVPSEIYKHGVEITVRGRYMDLLSYVAELEKSRWKLLWGPLSLKVDKYPLVTLKATVYTLSTQSTPYKF